MKPLIVLIRLARKPAWLEVSWVSHLMHPEGTRPINASEQPKTHWKREKIIAVFLAPLLVGVLLLMAERLLSTSDAGERQSPTTTKPPPDFEPTTTQSSTTTTSTATTSQARPTVKYLATDLSGPADYKGCRRPDTSTVSAGVILYAGTFGCEIAWADFAIAEGCSRLLTTVRLDESPSAGRIRIEVRDAVKGTNLIAPVEIGVDDKLEVDARWDTITRVRLQVTYIPIEGGSTVVFDNARLIC